MSGRRRRRPLERGGVPRIVIRKCGTRWHLVPRILIVSLFPEISLPLRVNLTGGESIYCTSDTCKPQRRPPRRSDPKSRQFAPPPVGGPPAPRRNNNERDRKLDRAGKAPRPGGTARIFFGAGRNLGIKPQNLVGAIAGGSGLSASRIGSIEIADRHSTVEVPEVAIQDVLSALRQTLIKGKKIPARRWMEK